MLCIVDKNEKVVLYSSEDLKSMLTRYVHKNVFNDNCLKSDNVKFLRFNFSTINFSRRGRSRPKIISLCSSLLSRIISRIATTFLITCQRIFPRIFRTALSAVERTRSSESPCFLSPMAILIISINLDQMKLVNWNGRISVKKMIWVNF